MAKGNEASEAKAIVLINYKGLPVVRDWLNDLAQHMGLPVTNIVDLALNEFAEKRQFRRMPRRQARIGRPPRSAG